MPKVKKRKLCTFKPNIKKLIWADGVLVVKLANMLNTSQAGIETMLKNNSQSLFHCSAIESISEALGIEQSDLKNCKR